MPPINLLNVPRLENEMDDWAGTPEQEIETLRVMVEQRDERIAELEQQLKRQASAAKMGMDAARKSGAIMYEQGKKMLAENSPEVVDSERAANAMLTDRVAELEQCLKEARANMEDWGSYVPEYFREKHDLQGDLAAIDRVLSGGEG